jgi:hypothetical protein
MKLAWFRAASPGRLDPLDDTAALIAELQSWHHIDIFTEANAHDFVWMHFQQPYDLCIHELGNTDAHDFVWPYLLHYGGVLLLRSTNLHRSRARSLASQNRYDDLRDELAFSNGSSMLRAPLLSATVVVISHEGIAAALAEEHPDVRIRVVPTGVARAEPGHTTSRITLGSLGNGSSEIVDRAIDRARESGAEVDLVTANILRDADIILALPWPTSGEPQTEALAGMAAGKPVVVFDMEATADWPSLDPQTWKPRGLGSARPIVVSVDPRDEEHSLAIAIRRLAADAELRERLGRAASDWWAAHATVSQAAERWRRILDEAVTLQPPAKPGNWPAHLTADGTERAKEILSEMGVNP